MMVGCGVTVTVAGGGQEQRAGVAGRKRRRAEGMGGVQKRVVECSSLDAVHLNTNETRVWRLTRRVAQISLVISRLPAVSPAF